MLKEELIHHVKMLLEAKKKKKSGENLKGTVGTDSKGISHVSGYVFPFLSSKGRKKTLNNFKNMEAASTNSNLWKTDAKSDGEKYDPKATHTHVLHTATEEHPAGTKVRVTHVTVNKEGALTAHTEKHGSFSLSKLKKPYTRAAKGQRGFSVETKLSKHLGTKAAGSASKGFDFHYRGVVRGAVKVVETKKKKAVKGTDRPDVRGESKLIKGKFGQSVVSFENGKWGFREASKGASKMDSIFKQARVKSSNMKILDHLNTHHKDGKIDQMVTATAAKGTSRHYLNSSEINSLHIHHRKVNPKTKKVVIDRGTTYTVGRTSLKDRTNLSHLSDKHLDALDGDVQIMATKGVGKKVTTEIVHRPKQTVMRELADASHTDPNNHRDLTNADHAAEFKTHVDRHITEYVKSRKKKKKKMNEEAPVNVAPTSPTSGNIQYADPIMKTPMLRRKKPKTLQQFKEELIDDDNRKNRTGEVDRVTTKPSGEGEHDVYVGDKKHKEVKVVNGSGGVAGLRRNLYGIHHIPKNKTRWVGSLTQTRRHLQQMHDAGAL